MTGDWLRDMLIASGHLDEHGLGFKARLRRHRPCRGLTVAGIDDNGLSTWCEPTPLSPSGEAEALLSGRATWDLFGGSGLTYRRAAAIAYRPAGDHRRPVLAEHLCGQSLPAAWLAPRVTPATAPTSTEVPF